MQRLIELAEWLEENPDVPDKLWLSGEAHCYLSGETLQNKVHWEKECPYVLEAIVIVAIALEASRVPVEMMNRASRTFSTFGCPAHAEGVRRGSSGASAVRRCGSLT